MGLYETPEPYERVSLNLDNIEQASEEQLRNAVRGCFEQARKAVSAPQSASAWFAEAQFYIAELQRRDAESERKYSRRISFRDLILEVVVIILIGVEIYEGIQQSKVLDNQLTVLQTVQTNAVEQGNADKKLWDKQNDLLTKLQEAAGKSADSSERTYQDKATVKSLESLQSSTDSMSKATQAQLALFYDVQLQATWEDSIKKVRLSNNGRVSVVITRVDLDHMPINLPSITTITPGSGNDLGIQFINNEIEEGAQNKPKTHTLTFTIKNNRQESFVMEVSMNLTWHTIK